MKEETRRAMREAEERLEQSDFSIEDVVATEPVSFGTDPQTSGESKRTMQEAVQQLEESEFSIEDVVATEPVDFDIDH